MYYGSGTVGHTASQWCHTCSDGRCCICNSERRADVMDTILKVLCYIKNMTPPIDAHLGLLEEQFCQNQGCVRGQHGRGQGHKILSSRTRPVLEDPHPWAFYRAMLRRERLFHVVCLSITPIQRPSPPLVRLCMKYCIYGIESFTGTY